MQKNDTKDRNERHIQDIQDGAHLLAIDEYPYPIPSKYIKVTNKLMPE